MKYARLERERRFLLARVPAGVEPQSVRLIHDMYVTGTRLRLRVVSHADGSVVQRKLTQKWIDETGAESAVITNLYLDQAEFDALSVLGGHPLVKRRFDLVADNRRFAVDVFDGPLDGLVLAEIELSDEEPAGGGLPSFAAFEVTSEPMFRGGALATSDAALVLAEVRRRLAGR